MSYEITKYGVPRKMVSCPGCGQIYGHHNTKTCTTCQECSSCCRCKKEEKNLILSKEFIQIILR